MGYSVEIHGEVRIGPPLSAAQVQYVNQFCGTRRMKRDPAIAARLPDPIGKAINMPIGDDGAYFVGGTGIAGQDRDPSIVSYNEPPKGQPSLWCSWEVSDDGRHLRWNGAEKFHRYVDWLRYLIENFFAPWGCVLTGEMDWQGDDETDIGVIKVIANKVSTSTEPKS
jgi:hypothetical protein